MTRNALETKGISVNDEHDDLGFIALSLIVSDLERSSRFYCEGLGFEAGLTKDRGNQVADTLELPTCQLRMRYLGRPDIRVELVQFSEPVTVGQPTRKPSNHLGLQAFSFVCDDADASAAKLVELGGSYVLSGKAGGGRYDMVMVTDPDGLRIQLLTAQLDEFVPLFGG